jgi:3-oxoacyl-[acyl-carrier protein] reductase
LRLRSREMRCDLLLTGRDCDALKTAAQSIRSNSRRAAIHVADLRDPSAAAVLIEAVRREFGGLDILINNAGATKRGDFFALTDAGGHQARILDISATRWGW